MVDITTSSRPSLKYTIVKMFVNFLVFYDEIVSQTPTNSPLLQKSLCQSLANSKLAFVKDYS